MNWSRQEDARLRELAPMGHLQVEIAEILTQEFGRFISKDAVIGRRNRLGMCKALPHEQGNKVSQAWERRRGASPPPVRAPAPTPITTIDTDLLIPEEQRKTLMELELHHCRWPVNEGASMFFCGATTEQTYCPEHAARAYQDVRPPNRFFMQRRWGS
jgi:hypothetical protein